MKGGQQGDKRSVCMGGSAEPKTCECHQKEEGGGGNQYTALKWERSLRNWRD